MGVPITSTDAFILQGDDAEAFRAEALSTTQQVEIKGLSEALARDQQTIFSDRLTVSAHLDPQTGEYTFSVGNNQPTDGSDNIEFTLHVPKMRDQLADAQRGLPPAPMPIYRVDAFEGLLEPVRERAREHNASLVAPYLEKGGLVERVKGIPEEVRPYLPQYPSYN